MKKILIYLLFLSFFGYLYGNTKNNNKLFEGSWIWTYNPKNADIPENMFTLKIEKIVNDQVKAQYCAIAQSGNRIDCSNEIEFNIIGSIQDNKILAAFYSFFGAKNGKVEIELLGNTLQWKVTKDPIGSDFYAPKKVTLIKEALAVEN